MAEINRNSRLYVFYDYSGSQTVDEVDTWPSHITLTPYFTPPTPEAHDALSAIAEVARATKPFMLRLGQLALYGPNNDVPVTEIPDPDGKLHDLHLRLLEQLGNMGCTFSDLTHTRANYSPHITHKQGEEPSQQAFMLDSLSVGERRKAQKLIVAQFALGGS